MRRTRGGLGVGAAAKLMIRLKRSRKRAQTRIAEREECAICMNPLGPQSGTKTLPCTHTFHTKCIDGWMERGHRTCPMCRQQIPRGRQTVGQLVEEVARMDAFALEDVYNRQREGSRNLHIYEDEIDHREELGRIVTDALDHVILGENYYFDNEGVNYQSTVGDFLAGHPTAHVIHVIRQNYPRLAALTNDQILNLELYRDVIRLTSDLFNWDTMDDDPGLPPSP